jgi:HlyD family secretion protein
LLVLAALGYGAWWLLQHDRQGAPALSGTIECDVVQVASRYGGRVTRLHVREGDNLTNGQLIAELDAAELIARRDQATATLRDLETGPRTNELAAAKYQWDALTAQLALARTEARRAEELFNQRAIDAAERDRAASRVAVLEQQAAAAAAQHALLVEGTRPETIVAARARVAEIESQLAEMTVRAPGAAVLETLPVRVGDVVGPNRPVATLLPVQQLWVRVYVPEPLLGEIRVGLPVTVRSDAAGRPVFTGTVEQINRQAEFTPRNVQTVGDRVRQVFGVKIRLPVDERLRPGLSVEVEFNNVKGNPHG